MFEGVFFQFPKLGFLLFFYLGCEALCPLRSQSFYFPNTVLFGSVGVKSPVWLWIAKWTMITMFIIALMSPVKEHRFTADTGTYDILLALDSSSLDDTSVDSLIRFIDSRSQERMGLLASGSVETVVPMTREHEVLRSMIGQLPDEKRGGAVTRDIQRFFADSGDRIQWVVIVSDAPKSFVHSLPSQVRLSVVSPSEAVGSEWVGELSKEYPGYSRLSQHLYFDFYYPYPLFIGFLAMLVYLYGRNQKGMR